MAPLTTTNPLTIAKIAGISRKGLYGRYRFGSRNRKTIAPRTVRKRKENSPRPLKVRRARKLPNRIYSAERTVEKRRALIGASDLKDPRELDVSVFGLDRIPTWPTNAKKPGNQFLFAALTVIRPATKESPSKEPATTRHIKIAAMMPNAGPRSRVIAVFSTRYQPRNQGCCTENLPRPHCRSKKPRSMEGGYSMQRLQQ